MNVQVWTTGAVFTGGGNFYTRSYWYSAGSDDGFRLIIPGVNGSYTEPLAGTTFRTWGR